MVTKAELDAYRSANRLLDEAVERDVRRLFGSLRNASYDEARDALAAFMPGLVAKYGEASAAIAAELFEQVIGERSRVVVVTEADRIAASVRGTLDPLFKRGDWDTAENSLVMSMTRHVRQSGRDTIASSASATQGVAYARVLGHGGKTGPCSWCVMLASRGPVYGSRETAKWAHGSVGNEYHDDCTCEAIPARGEWIPDASTVRGARWAGDPVGDDFEELYSKYYKPVWTKGANDREVATLMRANFGFS